jgi:hypothetical protein
VDRLLAASRYHARVIGALAARHRYADAVRRLTSIVEPNGVELPAIFAERMSANARLWRIGVRFGLRPRQETHGRTLVPITLAELRERGRTYELARVALAAFGEPPVWTTAHRLERAAYCLNRLITTRQAVS